MARTKADSESLSRREFLGATATVALSPGSLLTAGRAQDAYARGLALGMPRNIRKALLRYTEERGFVKRGALASARPIFYPFHL